MSAIFQVLCRNWMGWLLVVAGLGLIGVIPAVADYVALALGICGFCIGIGKKDPILTTVTTAMVAVAALLTAATLPFTYKGAADLMPFGVCILLLSALGGAVILARTPDKISPIAFHLICLAGVSVSLLAGVVDFLLTHVDRIGAGNNPIHYAALAVMLGFLALPGVGVMTSRWRLIFLLGPLFATGAVMLSGSRGPFIALLLLGAVSAICILVSFRRDRLLMGALAGLVVFLTAALLAFGGSGRAMSIVTALGQMVGGSGPIDEYRAAMYLTAYRIVCSAPLYGIGFGQVMPLITASYPELAFMYALPDLHSDSANFVGSAGIPGLVAYALLVTAPLPLLRRSQSPLNMTIAVLTAGQIGLGLTNSTFGILPQTMLYATALAYCMASAGPRGEKRSMAASQL